MLQDKWETLATDDDETDIILEGPLFPRHREKEQGPLKPMDKHSFKSNPSRTEINTGPAALESEPKILQNKETIKIKDDQLKTQISSTKKPLNNGNSQYSASREE